MNLGLKWGRVLLSFMMASCSVTAVRPSQQMSDMEVSMKAALEVNADTLAPEIYRLASESALVARKEYKFKNFLSAKKYAEQARGYAERAEFEAIRNGAKRESAPQDPLATPSYAPEPVAEAAPVYGDAPAPAQSPASGGASSPGGAQPPAGAPVPGGAAPPTQ
jgi:hypothetical protein